MYVLISLKTCFAATVANIDENTLRFMKKISMAKKRKKMSLMDGVNIIHQPEVLTNLLVAHVTCGLMEEILVELLIGVSDCLKEILLRVISSLPSVFPPALFDA